ncbi:hypothetical protein SAMN02983003_3140 [Devosia enhydra]|uniref:Uncharacterized protein n=1 Tax=Devosia enhydra TaxID=665118 RepID=A0A1K2I0X1_9HYPH|nr:hypothetical protein [Devosia enhydra]SFZ85968.1 hypothetical protein SAMN02983003_3140 [Devosia enhydra]
MSAVLRLRIGSAEPLLRGNDHFWRVIMELSEGGSTFTLTDVEGRSECGTRAPIRDFVRRLVKGGLVEATPPEEHGAPTLYRLIERSRSTPTINRDGTAGRQGRGQQQMWNVMRRETGGWTAQELAISASTDEVSVSAATALAYTRTLCQAGLLVVVTPGGPGKKQVWRLKGSANTGPKPPKILRSKLVYDANTGKVLGDVIAEEVDP